MSINNTDNGSNTNNLVGPAAPEAAIIVANALSGRLPKVLHEEDQYMHNRTGCYEYRAVRYAAAAEIMLNSSWSLGDLDTVCDLGAGWTELDYFLRTQCDWRGRYFPVDAILSEVDLEVWEPSRKFEWMVALEVAEHLHNPETFLRMMQKHTTHGVVVSVPDRRSVDVFAIDETHVTQPDVELLESLGFTVESRMFYGGVYSGGRNDALLAWWIADVDSE